MVLINWPIVGMLPLFFQAIKNGFHETLTEVLRDHKGTFTFKGPWFCNFDCVLVADPCNLEYICKTNFINFCKGKSHHALYNLFGDSIFNVDGEHWRSLRKTLSTMFRMADFNRMSRDALSELIQSRFIPVCESFVKQSVTFDLHDMLSRMTFDYSVMLSFGINPGYLNPDFSVVKFAKDFENAERLMAIRLYVPMFFWKLMRYLNLGWEREMKRSVETVNDFTKQVIATRKMELNTSNSKPRFDFLSLFMEMKDENGNPLEDSFFRDNCLVLILAGADTISVGLSWFFWFLHQNPIVEERIHSEICDILGKKEDSNALLFAPEEVKKMHCLQAALTETLRLYPPTPYDQREVQRDDQLPNGTKLKTGCRVVYSMYAMGRMESIWGKDCREFKPERWLKDGEFIPESQYKFSAFNAGLRNCLGKDLAYYEMKVIAASILCRYHVSVAENHPVEPKTSIMLWMKYGLKVTLKERAPAAIASALI